MALKIVATGGDDSEEVEETSLEVLSVRLAAQLRETLRPTLEDQLTGMDSP